MPFQFGENGRPAIRSLMKCTCIGYRTMTSQKVCKHVGGVLLGMVEAHADEHRASTLKTRASRSVERRKEGPGKGPDGKFLNKVRAGRRSQSPRKVRVSTDTPEQVHVPVPLPDQQKDQTAGTGRPLRAGGNDPEVTLEGMPPGPPLESPEAETANKTMKEVQSEARAASPANFWPKKSNADEHPKKEESTDREDRYRKGVLGWFYDYDREADHAAPLLEMERWPEDISAGLSMYVPGSVLSFMNARETHKMANYLLLRASDLASKMRRANKENPKKVRVHLTAYGFDLDDICSKLIRCHELGCKVSVVADEKMSLGSQTREQSQKMNQLLVAGVPTYTSRGKNIKAAYLEVHRKVPPGVGIQHAKCLQCDEYLIVGSTNWTTSSKSNEEMSVLLYLGPEGMKDWDGRRDALLSEAEPYTSETQEEAQRRRELSAQRGSKSPRRASPRRPDTPRAGESQK